MRVRLFGIASLVGLVSLASLGHADGPPAEKLTLSGLTPAKVRPGLCGYTYRVSTDDTECQALVDQGLGYFYSYVWMEAARSFETAVRRDPDCAFAWLGLSKSLEKWGKKNSNDALTKAKDLIEKAGEREKLLIRARCQEKGLWPDTPPEQRKPNAVKTIDELLTLYDDDEEGWFARAQLADGFNGPVPFYKALLRLNPLHPGASHELVHFYENSKRPALGWKYADAYIASSPGIPHPHHMQAHLATRLGRWDRSTDLSARAIELETAYHKEVGVKPLEDHQYSHHLEILTISLVHDGRFREARAVKQLAQDAGFKSWGVWFRLHLAEGDHAAAEEVIAHFRKTDKLTAAYYAALLALDRGEPARALPEVEVLREGKGGWTGNKQQQDRANEAHGLWMCQAGTPESGVKLLARVAERTKADYAHHAWGNGAVFMESWGLAALRSGLDAEAEEGLLEALAHDPASVRAAVGLQLLCERQGRAEEAARYAELARKAWRKADPGKLDALRAHLSRPFPPAAELAPMPRAN